MIVLYIFVLLYAIAMLFILLYGFAQADLLIQYWKKPKEEKSLPVIPHDSLPKITVQLPIFNERYVVERLIHAVAKFNYPTNLLEIQLLDDSTDSTSDIIQKTIKNYPDINFDFIHRENRQGYKAGALKEGLAQAQGEFIAIFDADFVPDPNFILQTIPHFQDPEVGMVQSRWTHLNEDYSIFTRLQAFALDAHFTVEQTGRNRQQAFINFNGTGGIWRKSCILDAGNWEADTLTEDLDLSYRAQQKGWKFIYREDIESPAELPPVMSAIKSQQFRWTKGGAECATKHLKNVWREKHSLHKKWHATAHLLNAVLFVAVLTVAISSIPIWWGFYNELLPTWLFTIAKIFLAGFVIVAGVYLSANISLAKYKGASTLKFLWELPLFLMVSMGLSLHNSQAVIEGLTGKKSPFIRTPKYNLKKSDTWWSNPYHSLKMPITTYLEAGLALVFGYMLFLAISYEQLAMVVFHGMLFVGFSIVSVTSFLSYRSN
ncbi:cellulose synthase family protein [Mongoliitalea daihaiensis]|uniref:cellulose synthase family protein n=1 Tax=Mongoliitalea daihaiensis TaxID=2782006 RepID=UPI001F34D851|nr:cellulose synthase family protein [Mongoliitalea daihaiensis]UJP64779.1 glycosyltransferase [Mongoliitalea daihaiensis]